MTRTTLAISGMTCGHCVASVKQALQQVDGATVEQVAVGRATVQYDAARTTAAQLADAVTGAGYAARVATA